MTDERVHAKKDILECNSCKIFTFKVKCPECGKPTENVRPARYSPEDHYAKYRRIAKEGKK
jgi:H/ACA ribonucleoprotein complex subunit 3